MITRRTLVRGSTAFVGLGLFACASARPKPRPKAPGESVRVAVVGVRSRGNAHVKAFQRLPDVEVVALCDVDTEILAKRAAECEEAGSPVETFVDYRRLLDRPDIDAVSIATPNHWHALQAIWACQAGKDVYLEKPVSHNVWEGGQIVAAARKYERIVQTGTQCRSSEALAEAIAWTQAGNLGRILRARGLCYKPRKSIGKVLGPQRIPESVDYDLWTGPAPLGPLMRKHLHYDWHWDFATGNGDLGNQGIHQMDICRWAIGNDRLPPRVFSVGGRFGYDDDGNTPNTQIVLLDYPAAPIFFEVRGLPRDKAAQETDWNGGGMDTYEGARIGVVVECTEGRLVIPSYDSAIAYAADGEEVERWKGSRDHFANFIDALRTRQVQDLASDIGEGHVSSAMCHLGNDSYRLGALSDPGVVRESVLGRPDAAATWERMAAHLEANEIDLVRTPPTLGPWLEFDPTTERFLDVQANELLTRDYRLPFVVPERV